MGSYKYGCKKVERGVMNATTGVVTWDEKEIEVYDNTININWEKATKTEHFAQGDSSPKVMRYGRRAKTVDFKVMDTSTDSKIIWLGGTKTTVENKTTWHAPKKDVLATTNALRFTLEDDSVITIPQLSCANGLEGVLDDTNIALIPITGTPLSTGISSVNSFDWTD